METLKNRANCVSETTPFSPCNPLHSVPARLKLPSVGYNSSLDMSEILFSVCGGGGMDKVPVKERGGRKSPVTAFLLSGKKTDLHTNTFVLPLLKWWMPIPAKRGLYYIYKNVIIFRSFLVFLAKRTPCKDHNPEPENPATTIHLQ